MSEETLPQPSFSIRVVHRTEANRRFPSQGHLVTTADSQQEADDILRVHAREVARLLIEWADAEDRAGLRPVVNWADPRADELNVDRKLPR